MDTGTGEDVAEAATKGNRQLTADLAVVRNQKSPPKGENGLSHIRQKVDPELVAEDSERLGAALRRVLEGLPDGSIALVVGHSPTNEAAVLGLTGEIAAPLAKGAGVRVIAGDDGYHVESVE